MKLLKKKVLDNQIAIQRKNQIDEGISIANKIVTLRNTLSSLELQHSQFISKSKAELEDTLLGLSQGIRAKKNELIEIEAKRMELLKPLDEEWKILNQEKDSIESLKEGLYQKVSNVSQKEEKLDGIIWIEKDKLSKIKIRDKGSEEAYQRALKIEDDAKKNLFEANLMIIQMNDSIDEKAEELMIREAQIAVRERENDIAREHNESDRKEIIKKEAQLADQRATLERAFNRIKT